MQKRKKITKTDTITKETWRNTEGDFRSISDVDDDNWVPERPLLLELEIWIKKEQKASFSYAFVPSNLILAIAKISLKVSFYWFSTCTFREHIVEKLELLTPYMLSSCWDVDMVSQQDKMKHASLKDVLSLVLATVVNTL